MKLTRQHAFVCVATLASMVGFVLVMSMTSRCGAGLTPDSVGYVSVARSIVAGRGLVTLYGHPLVAQPPLFPGLLALLASLMRVDPVAAVRPLNALLFAVTIGLSSAWLLRTLRSPLVAILGCLMIALSGPLLAVSTVAWSEPLFILLMLLFIGTMAEYLTHPRHGYLVGAAAAVALASLTRYIGLTCLAIGAGVLLASPGRTIRQKLVAATWFCSIAALPLGIWLLRNLIASGTLSGFRPPSSTSSIENTWAVLKHVSHWFLPGPLAPVAGILGAVVLGAMGLARMIPRVHAHLATGQGARDISIGLCAAFTLVYTAWLIATSTMVAYDPIDSRLCSPLYVPLVFVMLWTCDRVVVRERRRAFARIARVATGALLAAILAIQVRATVRTARTFVAEGGRGYASNAWRHSPLVDFVRSQPPGTSMASNVPEALYILTNRSARLSPCKHAYNSPMAVHGDVEALASEVSRTGPMYLVWSTAISGADYLYQPDELASWFHLRLVARLADGLVYEVSPRPTSGG